MPLDSDTYSIHQNSTFNLSYQNLLRGGIYDYKNGRIGHDIAVISVPGFLVFSRETCFQVQHL